MAHETTTPPRAEVRRRDRAVADEGWIRDLLRRAPFGTLATARDGQPFLNTNLFVYDEAAHALYLHTARAGRTRSARGSRRSCSGTATSRASTSSPPITSDCSSPGS